MPSAGLKLFCFAILLASQIYDVLQKKGGSVCSPTFFLNLGNAVNSPSGIPCLSSPLTASSISGYATAQLSGYGTSMVYICKLMSWQKRGHLLGNAPPLASAATQFGEEWGLLRIRHRP